MAKNLDSTSPSWWTLAQMLVWILQQVERPPQDAEQFCNELNPEIIEEALNALTRALFNVICGAVEGLPVVAARVLCGHRYEDLAAFFQPLPLQPSALDVLMHELRQFIGQSDVEYNPVWGKRSWPARVSAVPTRPTESAEPIPAAEPGSEESQPPNKPDLVDAPMPATGPVRSFNVGYVDPAIAHALAHVIKRARPVVSPSELVPTTGLAGDTNPSQSSQAQRQPQQTPPAAQSDKPAIADPAPVASTQPLEVDPVNETKQPPPAPSASAADVRSQAAPPPAVSAGNEAGTVAAAAKEDDFLPASEVTRSKRGRRAKVTPELERYIFKLLDHHGLPSPDDPDWSSQADVEKILQDRAGLAETQAREHARRLIDTWKAGKAERAGN